MAFSKLSGDEQGIIVGQLRNALEPRLVMYFSSANKELRALLPPALQRELRADYEEATALCLNVGMRDCKELREATEINWYEKGLTAADLATLAKLGSVLPALVGLWLEERSASAESPTGFPDGALRLADGLVAGALPALTYLTIGLRLGDAGASALAAALDRGALPRLEFLDLDVAAIGDAALVALAPVLRRLSALDSLRLWSNPFGDEGLAALVAPPPPAGTPPRPAGGLKKLKTLNLMSTQVTDDGCATLVAALDSGALPALYRLELEGIPSAAAIEAVHEAMARSRWHAHEALARVYRARG